MYTHVSMDICRRVCVYIYIYTNLYTCMCVYIYIYIHTIIMTVIIIIIIIIITIIYIYIHMYSGDCKWLQATMKVLTNYFAFGQFSHIYIYIYIYIYIRATARADKLFYLRSVLIVSICKNSDRGSEVPGPLLIYIYIYVHTYIHTYTHTYIHEFNQFIISVIILSIDLLSLQHALRKFKYPRGWAHFSRLSF